jgi:hypothetical protein
VAQPISDREQGGRFDLKTIREGRTVQVIFDFGGPPAPASTADLLMPWFLPMTGIEITDGRYEAPQ